MTVSELREAVYNMGPHPEVHELVLARHRREAPKVWAAIDKLLAGPNVNNPWERALTVNRVLYPPPTRSVRREARRILEMSEWNNALNAALSVLETLHYPDKEVGYNQWVPNPRQGGVEDAKALIRALRRGDNV